MLGSTPVEELLTSSGSRNGQEIATNSKTRINRKFVPDAYGWSSVSQCIKH